MTQSLTIATVPPNRRQPHHQAHVVAGGGKLLCGHRANVQLDSLRRMEYEAFMADACACRDCKRMVPRFVKGVIHGR